jgi:hypothetical protein
MSEPAVPEPAAPAAPAQEPGFFHRAVEKVLPHEGAPAAPAAPAVVDEELKALLQGHSAAVFNLAGKVFSDPALKGLAPGVLDMVVTAAKIAGVAL